MGEQTIAPELEKCGKPGSSLVTQTKSTTALAAIKRTLDIVLEDTRGTVVRESLAQLDNSDQEGRLGQRLSHLSQGPEFLLSWLNASHAIIFVQFLQGAYFHFGKSRAVVDGRFLEGCGIRGEVFVSLLRPAIRSVMYRHVAKNQSTYGECSLAYAMTAASNNVHVATHDQVNETKIKRRVPSTRHSSKWNSPPF